MLGSRRPSSAAAATAAAAVAVAAVIAAFPNTAAAGAASPPERLRPGAPRAATPRRHLHKLSGNTKEDVDTVVGIAGRVEGPGRSDPALLALLEDEGVGELARRNAMGVWVGVANGSGTVGAACGFSDPTADPPVAAKTTDVVPAGSITKAFTGAAVMRLVDAGSISLDEPVAPWVDRYFANSVVPNITLLGLGYPPVVTNVSFRDLLSMRSGLSDYSTSAVHAATEGEPHRDLDPLGYLANDTITPHKGRWRCGQNGTNVTACDPPTYNSVGFMLLALAVAGHANATSWERLDQAAAALPPSVRAGGRYNGLTFFRRGTCARYKGVVHFFAARPGGGYADQHNLSCLNGFGFGNVGLPATVAASFFYDVAVPGRSGIVSPEAVIEMEQFGSVLAAHRWEKYGLGLMWLPLERYGEADPATPGVGPYLYAVGHNGNDYGTYIHAGYEPTLGSSVAIALNKYEGLVANNGSIIQNPEKVFCMAYRAVFRYLGQGALGNAAFRCDDRPWRPPKPA